MGSLYQIKSKYFTCGIIIKNNRCIDCAPIVKYLKGEKIDKIKEIAKRKKWEIEKI